MKKVIMALLTLGLTASVYAHDEGHGPKVSDTGKYGGLVSAVVLKSDAKKGAGATMVHKAELVRSADGTLRVYLYDGTMTPLDLKDFSPKASATVAVKVKKKWHDTDVPLELKENYFTGKLPKIKAKPYNIDVTVKQGDKELLTAFDNLD